MNAAARYSPNTSEWHWVKQLRNVGMSAGNFGTFLHPGGGCFMVEHQTTPGALEEKVENICATLCNRVQVNASV